MSDDPTKRSELQSLQAALTDKLFELDAASRRVGMDSALEVLVLHRVVEYLGSALRASHNVESMRAWLRLARGHGLSEEEIAQAIGKENTE